MLAALCHRVAQCTEVRSLVAGKLGIADVGSVQHGFHRQQA
jgi:hypothetical protein